MKNIIEKLKSHSFTIELYLCLLGFIISMVGFVFSTVFLGSFSVLWLVVGFIFLSLSSILENILRVEIPKSKKGNKSNDQ